MSYDVLIPADPRQPMLRFQRNSLGPCWDVLHSPECERLMGGDIPTCTFTFDPHESAPNVRARALAMVWGVPEDALCGEVVLSPCGIVGAATVESTLAEARSTSIAWQVQQGPYIRPQNPLKR